MANLLCKEEFEREFALYPKTDEIEAKIEFSKLSIRARVATLASSLGGTGEDEYHARRPQTTYWQGFRDRYPQFNNTEIERIQTRFRYRVRKEKRRKARQAYDISCSGKISMSSDAIVPFQQGTLKHTDKRFARVPCVRAKKLKPETVQLIKSINKKLVRQFKPSRRRGKKAKKDAAKKDVRNSNVGYSLGRTVTTGGFHAKASKGISGSVHWNKHLSSRGANVENSTNGTNNVENSTNGTNGTNNVENNSTNSTNTNNVENSTNSTNHGTKGENGENSNGGMKGATRNGEPDKRGGAKGKRKRSRSKQRKQSGKTTARTGSSKVVSKSVETVKQTAVEEVMSDDALVCNEVMPDDTVDDDDDDDDDDDEGGSCTLQQEVIDMVRTVILEAFGEETWFKEVMHQYSAIPKDRFLADDIPCSHIWWTKNPKAFHAHIDTNTLAPAFVFCPNTYKGGHLIAQLPTGEKRTVKLEEGVVAGGSWAQHPHCNSPVNKGEDRRSFVVYLDHRVISKSYIVVDN
jgi:hypothetical protein